MEERSFVGVLILLLLCATGCSEGQSSLALDDAGRPTESLPVADISDGVPAVRDVWGSEVIMIDVVAETTPVDERDPVVDAASVPDSESGDTSVDAASVLDSDSEDTKDADGAEEEIVAATFPGCASPIVIDGQALPATLLPVPNMEFGILATTSCPWSPNYSDAWDAPVRDSFVFDAPVAGIFAFAVQAASCEPFFYVGDQCEKWTDSA